MKKQRPILFSTPMVQAILNGTKTETRRTTGLDIINEKPDNWEIDHYTLIDGHCVAVLKDKDGFGYIRIKCHYGSKGDILWVRETWKLCGFTDVDADEIKIQYKTGETNNIDTYGDTDKHELWNDRVEKLMYKLAAKGKVEIDDEREMTTWKAEDVPWTPSIHMPKDAARIWFKINNINIERLHDITEESAKNEGAEKERLIPFGSIGEKTYREGFFKIWLNINGPESLKINPWVWVIQFEQIINPNL